jgi:hypothetical protein
MRPTPPSETTAVFRISDPGPKSHPRSQIHEKEYFLDPIFWGRQDGAKRENCMPRTVVQIAADPSYLYALCNDGQIFRMVNHTWQPMMPIPQDDPPAKSNSATDPFADEQPGG